MNLLKPLLFSLIYIASSHVSAQETNIIAQSLFEGASHFYVWQPEETRIESLKKTSIYNGLLEKGLDVLAVPREQKLWVDYNNSALRYYFFSNIEKPIKAKFLIQRIKKVVSFYKKDKTEPYKQETTYLVEAFKTWSGISGKNDFLNGTLKKADSHWGEFGALSRNRLKVITKTYETGVGTIEALSEDPNTWSFGDRTAYWGTGYKEKNDYYDKVNFSDFFTWNLNVEVSKSSYKVESPELDIYQSSN